MARSPIRVLLVDDNQGVRRAVRRRLGATADVVVVGESGTVAEAVVDAETTRPDIIVLDLRLPDGSGVKAARRVRNLQPDVRVIILTSASDDEASVGAVIAGASAVLPKQLRGCDIVESIRRVAEGDVELDGDARARAATLLARHASPLGMLVADGKTDRQIASELDQDETSVDLQIGVMADTLRYVSRTDSG